MVEILVWGNPEDEFNRLNIKPKCTWIGLGYSRKEMRVYEVTDEVFKILCDEEERDYTWQRSSWRSAIGSNMGSVNARFKIAGRYIKAWDGAGRQEALEEVNGNTSHPDYCYENREYFHILEYFSEEIGASQPGNVCVLAVDLAKQNDIKMSELFQKCLPIAIMGE